MEHARQAFCLRHGVQPCQLFAPGRIRAPYRESVLAHARGPVTVTVISRLHAQHTPTQSLMRTSNAVMPAPAHPDQCLTPTTTTCEPPLQQYAPTCGALTEMVRTQGRERRRRGRPGG
eukprot:1871175-Rhodomonas_salina.3